MRKILRRLGKQLEGAKKCARRRRPSRRRTASIREDVVAAHHYTLGHVARGERQNGASEIKRANHVRSLSTHGQGGRRAAVVALAAVWML